MAIRLAAGDPVLLPGTFAKMIRPPFQGRLVFIERMDSQAGGIT